MDLRILGPLEVVGAEGTSLELPRGRAAALFALLTIRVGTVVSTDRLIDELWGSSPPSTARTKLQGLVSSLRHRIEPDRSPREDPKLLLTRPPGYVLAIAPGRVDAQRFRWLVEESSDAPASARAEILRQALDLWRGPALADFAYEPFAQSEISSLEELRIEAIEQRVEADLALHRHRELITELESLVTDHPFREGLRNQLMRALYHSGRQAEALNAYRDAERLFREELGIDPGPALQQLEQAILRQDPRLDPRPSHRDLRTNPEVDAEDSTESYLSEARKTVTVVFTEFVSEPADQDLERIHKISTTAQRLANTIFEEYGGTPQGFIGGVQVTVFGAPLAHEDDPLRAARASVRLGKELEALAEDGDGRDRLTIAPCTGISTGEVIIGDLTSRGGLSGDVASLAGTLQQEAEPGQTLMDERTRDLLGDAVLVEPVEAPTHDRHGRRITTWRLEGVIPGARPGQKSRRDAPMVGRDREIEWLRQRVQDVDVEGQAKVTLVLGEAGIGKTRLAMELATTLNDEVLVVTGHCQAFGERTTSWPIREIVTAVAGSLNHDAIEAAVNTAEGDGYVARQIARFLGGEHDSGRPRVPFAAMKSFFEALASKRSVIVVLEDVQWAQETLLDLVEYLGTSIQQSVLFLCIGRPELTDIRPSWMKGDDAVDRLSIGPLDDDSVSEIIRALSGNRPLSEEDRRHLVGVALGNPLFVEQMLAALREDPNTTIPASVVALLNARLDRLGPAERDVMRVASVLGSNFSVRVLSALLPTKARPSLDRHLEGLADKKLLVPQSDPDGQGNRYEFGHLLIRLAAYRSITMETRAHLHERIVDLIEAGESDGTSDTDEIVGYHLEQAYECRRALDDASPGVDDIAIRAGERLAVAGRRAFDRFDAAGGEDLLARARDLLPADHADSWAVKHKLAEAHQTMGRHEDALAILTEMLAKHEDDPRLECALRLERDRTRLAIGMAEIDLDEIGREAAHALDVYRAAGDRSGMAQALFTLAEIEQQKGNQLEMERLARLAMDHADDSGNTRYALGARRLVATALLLGPVPVAAGIGLCEELTWRGRRNAAVLPVLGQLHAMTGDFDTAREMLGEARRIFVETARARRPLGLLARRAAEVEILAGDLEAAERELRRALDLDLTIQVREEASRIASMLCLILVDQDRCDEAERFAYLAREQAPEWNVIARALSISAEARLISSRGELEESEALARRAVDEIPEEMPDIRADRLVDLAAVLMAAGRLEAGAAALSEAIRLHERKGNLAATERLAAAG